ncbi:MAG: type VI secretion system membrane subunit TssM, partial [Gammaproteobacteria bacterium]
MKKVVAVFKKKWVISLIGVLALSALIWFGGPLIAIAGKVPLASAVVRLLVILVVVLVWGLNNLRIQMQANRADKEMAAAASADSPAGGGAAPGQSAEEVATLKERFEEALSILRKSDSKRGGRSLYELPWYVIVGPPGSGKTTALVNSGLDFPLADRFGKEALRGVGGTRNCDWWFTNEAVLLDTAGRYVTQDSHAAADSAAWTGFLSLLKKHRRRRPINGALVAISIADIMVQNEQQRSAHVHAIRQRIQELHKELGIRFPIYLLFTKCDLVAGFMEFFDDLGREDRAQVWGFTFPEGASEDGSAVQHVGAEFDGLIQRVGERVYWRLNQERDTQRRALIQGFPAQMVGLKGTVEQFAQAIFQPSRYEDAPLLRGIYFTSGTQEGTPIDRLMGSLARTFGLDQKVLPSYGGHGRSYFIRDLLTEVVFPEAELAGANRGLERRRAWLQIGAYAGAIALAALAALAWSASFTRNAVYVHRIQDRVEQYGKVAAKPLAPNADIAQILPRLDALQAVTQVYGKGDDVPFLMGLGLYQGNRLGGEARAAYRSALNSLLLPRMVQQVEGQLANPGASPGFRYETLKLYLMLSDPQRLDAGFAKLWFGLDWQHSGSLDGDQVRRLQADLGALLQRGFQPVALNKALVGSVRSRLAQTPLADRLYARLKSDAQDGAVAPFQVAQDVNGAAQVFVDDGGALKAQVPALFTQAGYQQLFKPQSKQIGGELSEDNWVMGTQRGPLSAEERSQVDAAVQQLYFNDYIRHWQSMLDKLRIAPFHSLQQGANEVATLAGPSSPMVALLQAVASNTTLTRAGSGIGGKV